MIEYIQREEDGETVRCDSCGSEAPTGDFTSNDQFDKNPQRFLCEFCATTLTSNYVKYSRYDDFTQLRAEVWKAAACTFNMLRKQR